MPSGQTQNRFPQCFNFYFPFIIGRVRECVSHILTDSTSLCTLTYSRGNNYGHGAVANEVPLFFCPLVRQSYWGGTIQGCLKLTRLHIHVDIDSWVVVTPFFFFLPSFDISPDGKLVGRSAACRDYYSFPQKWNPSVTFGFRSLSYFFICP